MPVFRRVGAGGGARAAGGGGPARVAGRPRQDRRGRAEEVNRLKVPTILPGRRPASDRRLVVTFSVVALLYLLVNASLPLGGHVPG